MSSLEVRRPASSAWPSVDSRGLPSHAEADGAPLLFFFAEVVGRSMEVVEEINKQETDKDDTPLKVVLITDCGVAT